MAKLVVYIPEQRYEFELDDETADDFRAAQADEENPWGFDDLADMYVSDVHVEMETEFYE